MAGDGADTIFARASGAGKAGVAVIRISGPRALEHARAIAGRGLKARRPFLRTFRDSGGAVIDTGLVILFPGPQSFTGEDVAELHAHGSRAVEQGLADALRALGARPAQAGEFTRRALLNGKLDLAEAEGLADLIDAETDRQRKLALGQFGGRLSALAQGWRERLIEAAAPLEAAVDFPDEEDIPATVAAASTPAIGRLIEELEEFAQTAARARVIREGLTVAIIGAPNAGKSSLLNRLSGEDRAIVSDAPGTTRDVVSARLDLGGALVTVLDTAGLRDGVGDSVEQEGMRRTRLAAEGADVRIFLVDVSRETSFEGGGGAYGSMRRPGDLVVANKIDRGSAGAGYDLAVSALAGTGVADLAAALGRIAIERGGELDAGVTRTRHAEAVARALDALRRALERVDDAPELAAEDLRVAARALDGITGAIGADDLLDRIFSSFCIGK